MSALIFAKRIDELLYFLQEKDKEIYIFFMLCLFIANLNKHFFLV